MTLKPEPGIECPRSEDRREYDSCQNVLNNAVPRNRDRIDRRELGKEREVAIAAIDVCYTHNG